MVIDYSTPSYHDDSYEYFNNYQQQSYSDSYKIKLLEIKFININQKILEYLNLTMPRHIICISEGTSETGGSLSF